MFGFTHYIQKDNTDENSTQQTAKAMVLTCMDYRLVDDAVYAMIQKGYLNNYDEFVLAGASLGYINNDRWRNAFDDHVILAIKLHQINEIIVIDHRDCGYYKSIYGSDVIKQADRNKETMHHKTNIYKFAKHISDNVVNGKFVLPKLTISGYLMNLDGSIEQIGKWNYTELVDRKL